MKNYIIKLQSHKKAVWFEITSAGSLRQVVRKTASPQLRSKIFHCGFATRKFSVCDLRFACAIFIFAHSPQPQTTKMYREPF